MTLQECLSKYSKSNELNIFHVKNFLVLKIYAENNYCIFSGLDSSVISDDTHILYDLAMTTKDWEIF